MTRALLTLLLILSQFSVAAATRRRVAQHPSAAIPPAAIVAAARQGAEAVMAAGVPAVQIAVSHRGHVIYSEGFGMTDQESATAVTTRSVLQIASITKQFTAAAILRLAERGALSLDDRIEKFVPEFDPRGATITLRHLLSHTSGVGELPPPNAFVPSTRAQAIARINQQPLAFAPGSSWSYSNAGFKLAGFAIESITGRPFADFIHREFALPLGLVDTGVCGTSGLPLPEGYRIIDGKPTRAPALDRSVPFSAGALCSTASDLSRWSHLLATGRVMLPASYATMSTPATVGNAPATNGYALGLYAQQVLGRPAVWHDGLILGFHTLLLYFPEEDISVAAITNAMPAPSGGNPQLIVVPVAKAALDSL